ncbi:MAG TPA: hypothetical protein VFT29_12045 [Gemmatimonadaceae bacterium]|nr:hypothetical protein [Gemmatimonadaceae bacterium]
MRLRQKALFAALAVLVATPSAARAQTEENLRRAIEMYNQFNIEGARPILLSIISSLLSVSTEQKVQAFKYLGASYAVLDKPDSARTFFMAALDHDPFTDLDPREFSASELGAFNDAKLRLFKVAARPIAPQRLDSNYAFRLVTTHRANLLVELIQQSDSTRREVLYQGESDGPRDIRWSGLLRNGSRADSTIYELRVTGNSRVISGSGTDRQLFRIEHVYEPLEDTLPSIPQNELLPEQFERSAAWFDMAKGGAFAAAGLILPMIALNNDVKWKPHAGFAVAIGVSSAVISFSYRRSHRDIPANQRENNRRREQRAVFNLGVKERNDARKTATVLLICPVTGCPR